MSNYSLELKDSQKSSHSYYQIRFNAMASPCEVLIKTQDKELSNILAKLTISEVNRIECKYSRYNADSLLAKINTSNGNPVDIDIETYQLFNYAKELFNLSEGLFDITSGILGKLWNFQNQTSIPDNSIIKDTLSFIGFDRIQYTEKSISLPKGMQIDFGGIGKEYAVDQVAKILNNRCKESSSNFLINLGGDLFAKDYKSEIDNSPWKIGLENSKSGYINLLNGAVATSGTSQRSFTQNGKVYSHLLNPKTGWPIENPPKSVTCFAETCVLAGTFSSLAMLQGVNAESFLKSEEIEHILVR
ncbi:MAG: thiamine biosynthesis protein ApbE [Gammaproteobacteria bacterium]|nr:MAG: thiamine biosynthesis protein ApbE [Gammaproteobacteria bacterium]